MSLSIVIPYHGEDLGFLDTYEHQWQDAEEVILVLDGVDRPTPPWITRLEVKRGPEARNAGFARNLGAERATSKWLAFISASAYIQSDALKTLQATTLSYDFIDLKVAGCARMYNVKEIPLDFDRVDETLCATSEPGIFLIKKQDFLDVGGFDTVSFPTWGFENHDFLIRWMDSGGLYAPMIRLAGGFLKVYHLYHESDRPTDSARDVFALKYGTRDAEKLVAERFDRIAQAP